MSKNYTCKIYIIGIPRLIRGKLSPVHLSVSPRNIPPRQCGTTPVTIRRTEPANINSKFFNIDCSVSNDQRSSWLTVEGEVDAISISDSCMGSMASSVEIL